MVYPPPHQTRPGLGGSPSSARNTCSAGSSASLAPHCSSRSSGVTTATCEWPAATARATSGSSEPRGWRTSVGRSSSAYTSMASPPPSPSWPWSLRPQAYTSPSASLTTVKAEPAAASSTSTSSSAVTGSGASTSEEPPLPLRPCSPAPQVQTSPSSVKNTECASPAPTVATVHSPMGPITGSGEKRVSRSPRPRCPPPESHEPPQPQA
mmetsp:Transcript_6501/g.19220  ORF Transcript_6501/g.19220 Transcript_6501/m.19220 type:complete len:209 (-) Transcript_6501:373-999(-)